jgi:uncharacterized protein (DUF983 family)
MRPAIENLVSGRKRSESSDLSTFADKEFGKMIVYILILVFIHHFSVMFLETFTFRHFWRNLLIALGNTLFTTFLIICIEQLFLVKKRKK